MQPAQIEQRISRILHQAGYKFTKPRRQVADVVFNSERHLTAPEIVERVAAIDTSVGRMSVYRTLDLFTRLGIIRPVYQETPQARYAVVIGGHHHHIICQNCGAVIHFDDCPLDELKQTLEERFNFTIEGHMLEFFGHCKKCDAPTE
ncbi:MAG: transcriptional repressor [Chloroflexi bacterium]|nr:transcriptional repressor [Chloroflexota bacterium]